MVDVDLWRGCQQYNFQSALHFVFGALAVNEKPYVIPLSAMAASIGLSAISSRYYRGELWNCPIANGSALCMCINYIRTVLIYFYFLGANYFRRSTFTANIPQITRKFGNLN